VSDEALQRLARTDACAVSDALDALGITGAALGLHSVTTEVPFVGRAVTIELTDDTSRPSRRHLGTDAVDASGPDNVVVVAHDGRLTVSGWGGVLSAGASARGVAGVVVDGAVRDVDQARAYGLPVFARASVPRTARGRVVQKDWNVPVDVAGVRVSPGDYVIADSSGVVFVPAAEIGAVLAKAESIVHREALMAERALAGEPMVEVMGRDYESMLEKESS
jgi:4-hydroxy-4-methyl-2-oxoglutarate aldolase